MSEQRRGTIALAALLVLALLALGSAVLLSDGAAGAQPRVPGLGPQGRRAQFAVECGYSHSAPDDPIVHPGHPGRSHLHDFFGSTIVEADSTTDDLLGGPTTCELSEDTAAYWAPALLHHGQQVVPLGAVAYYRPAVGTDPTAVQAYPAGLVMIAGDPTATEPQPLAVAAWHCGSSPDLASEPPTCTPRAPLTARIAFPSCWDGQRLDAEDHRGHMSHARWGRCPASHPVPVPELVLEVRYPFHGDPAGLTLSAGSIHAVHADFMNAWDQDKLEREVRVCLRGGKVCSVVSNRATG